MRWIIPFLLLASTAVASDVVLFAPNDADVPGRVLGYRVSVNTPDFSGRPDVLINPDVSKLRGIVSVRYWKVNGSTVSEMSQAEKDLIDADKIQAAADEAAVQSELALIRTAFQNWGSLTEEERDTVLKRIAHILTLERR